MRKRRNKKISSRGSALKILVEEPAKETGGNGY